jgi:hypothetical protein
LVVSYGEPLLVFGVLGEDAAEHGHAGFRSAIRRIALSDLQQFAAHGDTCRVGAGERQLQTPTFLSE